MSYNYHLLRLRRPASCLNDLTDEHLAFGDWYEAWREILRASFPAFSWSETSETMRGRSLDGPRFEISLTRDAAFTNVIVSASFHSDQQEAIKALAAALGATAFDVQTGLALSPG
jgi:hypothetical protein